jgi:hypothetical protein
VVVNPVGQVVDGERFEQPLDQRFALAGHGAVRPDWTHFRRRAGGIQLLPQRVHSLLGRLGRFFENVCLFERRLHGRGNGIDLTRRR